MDRSIDAVKMLQARALANLRKLVRQKAVNGASDAGR